MKNVGFPKGLNIDEKDVLSLLNKNSQRHDVFNQTLVVENIKDSVFIGEAKLGLPDENGIAETDIKLLPHFWGLGYGPEIKQALVDYIFEHTDADIVQATPNVENKASQKMQRLVGANPAGKGLFHFPDSEKNILGMLNILFTGFPEKNGEKGESWTIISKRLLMMHSKLYNNSMAISRILLL